MIIENYTIGVHGIVFKLKFRDNLTLIDGDSGIGKTMLFKQIRNDALVNKPNIVCINKDNGTAIDNILKSNKNKVIVIDNAEIILNMRNRLFVSLDKNNQYIIFTHTTRGYKPNKYSFTELVIEGKKGRLDYSLD